MPLNQQVTLHAFKKWAVDFIGPINPPTKRTRYMYIITVKKYLTIWVEVEPFIGCTVKTTGWFLFENIVTRFECTKVLMSNQGNHFLNKTIATLTKEFQI